MLNYEVKIPAVNGGECYRGDSTEYGSCTQGFYHFEVLVFGKVIVEVVQRILVLSKGRSGSAGVVRKKFLNCRSDQSFLPFTTFTKHIDTEMPVC